MGEHTTKRYLENFDNGVPKSARERSPHEGVRTEASKWTKIVRTAHLTEKNEGPETEVNWREGVRSENLEMGVTTEYLKKVVENEDCSDGGENRVPRYGGEHGVLRM